MLYVLPQRYFAVPPPFSGMTTHQFSTLPTKINDGQISIL
jgi:hypothetical protein